MATKRPQSPPDDPSNPKKQRKVIDLEMKLKILKEFESGKRVNHIAHDLGMSHSTITTIIKRRDRWTEASKGSASPKSTRLTKTREGPICDMEKMLMVWIAEQNAQQIVLTHTAIMAKAKTIFDKLKKEAGSDYNVEFSASTGWFKGFQQRYCLDNLKACKDAKSNELKTINDFKESLDKAIVDGSYLPQQIFNIAETALFWKQTAEISNHDHETQSILGFKAFKDRVTVVLGGNVSGYKLKPLVIWRNENPKAFRNINKHTLPVYYRNNLESVITPELFQDALLNCYSNEIEKYCLKESIPFKILIILNNAIGHSPILSDLHPNIKIIFLPNPNLVIQPMDQGVFATFKLYYLKRTLSEAIVAIEDNYTTITQFWEQYNIYHCIKNFAWAWEDVTRQCMTGVWKKLLKRFVYDVKEFNRDDETIKLNRDIVELATILNFELNVDDIDRLLDVQFNDCTEQEWVDVKKECVDEDDDDEFKIDLIDADEAPKMFTVEGLAKFFVDLKNLLKSVEDMDPNTERFSLIERNAHAVFAPYKEIYEEKKKQAAKKNN